jgi:hypothetical protein
MWMWAETRRRKTTAAPPTLPLETAMKTQALAQVQVQVLALRVGAAAAGHWCPRQPLSLFLTSDWPRQNTNW